MIRRAFAVLSAVFCLVSCNNESQRMPIYVEPWYNSEPFTIQVGKFSDVLKSEDVKKLQSTADVIRAEIDNTPIETLYVLAIRFYDLGQKDDAVYWFYTAQFRRNLYARMIENVGGVGEPAFECRQAQLASINCPGNGLTVMQVVYRINGLKYLLKLLMKVPKAEFIIVNFSINAPYGAVPIHY